MFNYANSIAIIFEQNDNMLELMNIYKKQGKKLIVLYECAREVMFGTGLWKR